MQVHAVLDAIQHDRLIDKDDAQGESLRVDQALGWHLTVAVKYALQLLVRVLNCRECSFWKMRLTSLPSLV